jgi:hypothetical protein
MNTARAPKERLRYEFGRHETFAVRHGWLGRGAAYVAQGGSFADEAHAIVTLGLGSRMVKSLRYWLEATNLVVTSDSEDGKARRGGGSLSLTDLAMVIRDRDPHLEFPATWWFLHLALARRANSVWGWFFSDFRERHFDRPACVDAYTRHLRLHAAKEPSLAVAQRDVACVLGAYASVGGSVPEDPEDGTVSPLRELGLLVKHEDTGRFERTRPLDGVPMEAFLACVTLAAADADAEALSVGEMLSRARAPGSAFGLDSAAIEELSQQSARVFARHGVAFDLLGGERRLRVPHPDASYWLQMHFDRIRAAE